MLYEDKNGTYWDPEEVELLPPDKIKELGIHCSTINSDDFFD